MHIYNIIQAEQTDQKSDNLFSSVDKSVENKEGPTCSDHSCAEETDQGTDSDDILLNSVLLLKSIYICVFICQFAAVWCGLHVVLTSVS